MSSVVSIEITEALVSVGVRTTILSQSGKFYPHETGGILVGCFVGPKVLIRFATLPGPAATHGFSKFMRDGKYSQRALDVMVRRTRGRCDYIGEWHSHPRPVGPSPIDVRSMAWIAKNRRYRALRPVLGLSIRVDSTDTRIEFFILVGTELRSLSVVKQS